jgi:ribonuclease Z
MRKLLGVLAAVMTLVSGAASAADHDLRVTLLGTSAPPPLPDRFGPSTLVQAGGQNLVFDAGRGVTIRLGQLKVPLGKVDALFLTHYHSDHTVGLPDLWLTAWLPTPFASRKTPLHVIGPTGAKAMMDGLRQAYAADLKIREADEKLSPDAIAVNVDEFDKDGVVYDKDGVRVTAFEVHHGDLIKPSYGYRIDYAGHSAVISGDTTFNENVIKYGTDADVLIHEVAAAPPEMLKIEAIQRILAHHTSPQETGTVFTRAHPKLAVYSHIVRLGNAQNPELTLPELVAQARQTYKGPLVVGEDLMTFDISDGGIAIYRGGNSE